MTSKLTITRERLEEIRDYDTCVTLEESAELACMALAAMDSEPVAPDCITPESDIICRVKPEGIILNNRERHIAAEVWNACRAAMLQAGNSPVIPGAEQRIADAVELLKQAAPAMLADNSSPDGPLVGRLKPPVIGIDPASGPDHSVEVRYVAPPGYVMVPKEPTKEMIDAGWQYFWDTKNPSSKGTYKAMLAAAPQEVPDGQR